MEETGNISRRNRLDQYMQFIEEVERLKSVVRTAWTSTGRRESTAEHSWRLALLAFLLLGEYPELDGKKVLTMCLVHDLGELYDGDISAALQPDEEMKLKNEQQAVKKAVSLLPDRDQEIIFSIWKEYSGNESPEAHLVKALDKAETIIQHNQGVNPPDFDYEFNLQYGAAYFHEDSLMEELRARLDEETGKHVM